MDYLMAGNRKQRRYASEKQRAAFELFTRGNLEITIGSTAFDSGSRAHKGTPNGSERQGFWKAEGWESSRDEIVYCPCLGSVDPHDRRENGSHCKDRERRQHRRPP